MKVYTLDERQLGASLLSQELIHYNNIISEVAQISNYQNEPNAFLCMDIDNFNQN